MQLSRLAIIGLLLFPLGATHAAEDDCPPTKLGPVLPEELLLLDGWLGESTIGTAAHDHRIRTFGWANFGYTASSSGSGMLAVEPRENRFGNEFLVNQLGLVVERTLDPDRFSLGWRAMLYAGADASLIQPLGGIDFPPGNPRFSADFRELYVSAHLPVLTSGGVDLKLGRQNSVIGYESALAPYRPFYSNAYQWFYSEDGAYTGAIATFHATPQLDLVAGATLGGNTFYTIREDGPCFLGQVNYWTTPAKQTLLSAAVYTGPGSILAFTPPFEGRNETMIELRVQHDWTDRLTQIVQSNMGWATEIEGVGTAAWYGVYTIGILHLTDHLDLNSRAEWFNDEHGSRTGVATDFTAVTLGVTIMPRPWLNIRPELRGDFAGVPAFGANSSDRSQLTAAVEMLFKF